MTMMQSFVVVIPVNEALNKDLSFKIQIMLIAQLCNRLIYCEHFPNKAIRCCTEARFLLRHISYITGLSSQALFTSYSVTFSIWELSLRI